MSTRTATCDCCGFTEECTPAYIAAVRAEYLGRWVCGLCAEAVRDEVRRGAGITTAEALDRQRAFARAARRAPGRAAVDLVAAVSRVLRRRLESPPASPAQGRRKAAASGTGCGTDAEDA
ncbi:uncharacterized protein LOC100837135 [Brachypodium distachyon]|uniref:uncharacterized protein LOC100837135 n=1 Tax=Brachypodium distachyon TaxID=15368 RepID=UPI000234E703|nr:uncharacterized protein LOC100837135 [Brachypodium distachyon]|eukprot:XP_010227897.1 uncharacterized protein LOC100837135 [Brachypodium distachyon]